MQITSNIKAATSYSPAILFTRVSRNAKTGPIPVTTSSNETCPVDCAFRGNGCYAESGPLGALWRGMSNAGPNSEFKNGRGTVSTIDWNALCIEIKRLPKNQMWRHNQAGDLPSHGGKIDGQLVQQLVTANRGRNGFTYTHHNVLQSAENRAIVEHANNNGFTINLSGNNLRHADQLADLEIAPVVCVLPKEYERGNKDGEWLESLPEYRARTNKIETPAGRRVIPCPATYQDNLSCADCGICARLRNAIVGFPAHGTGKRKASIVAAA